MVIDVNESTPPQSTCKVILSVIDTVHASKLHPTVYYFKKAGVRQDKAYFFFTRGDDERLKMMMIMDSTNITSFLKAATSCVELGIVTMNIPVDLHLPRNETLPGEIWQCNIISAGASDGKVDIVMDWARHGIDKNAVMKSIIAFSESSEMKQFESAINIAKQGNAAGAVEDLLKKIDKSFLIDSYDPISFATAILGYKEHGNYFLIDNTLDYKVSIEMEMTVIDKINRELLEFQ